MKQRRGQNLGTSSQSSELDWNGSAVFLRGRAYKDTVKEGLGKPPVNLRGASGADALRPSPEHPMMCPGALSGWCGCREDLDRNHSWSKEEGEGCKLKKSWPPWAVQAGGLLERQGPEGLRVGILRDAGRAWVRGCSVGCGKAKPMCGCRCVYCMYMFVLYVYVCA